MVDLGTDGDVHVSFNGNVTYNAGTFDLQIFAGGTWHSKVTPIVQDGPAGIAMSFDSGIVAPGNPWRIITPGTFPAAARMFTYPQSGTVS